MNYTINDRISTIDNELATIKYIGPLPAWGPTTIALGLEWDNSERGKNNGDVNGIQYFQPTIPNSGSFIKSTNKKLQHERKSFISVIRSEYLDVEYENQQLSFSQQKVVEEIGFDRHNLILANLTNLKSITLDYKLINRAYDMEEDYQDIFGRFENLERLEISFNLFNDIEEVWKIVNWLPKLKELNINGIDFPSFLMRMKCILDLLV